MRLYTICPKMNDPQCAGHKSLSPVLRSLVLKRWGGGRKLLEAGDCHTLHVCKLLPFQEVRLGGPSARLPTGQKIRDQLGQDQRSDKWFHRYSNTVVISPSHQELHASKIQQKHSDSFCWHKASKSSAKPENDQSGLDANEVWCQGPFDSLQI